MGSDPDDVIEARAAEVKTWNVEWKANGRAKRITAGTWEGQVDRILKDFKAKYPQKYAALPFDVKEHYRWKVKYNKNFTCLNNELELYSMLYYDWSTHEED